MIIGFYLIRKPTLEFLDKKISRLNTKKGRKWEHRQMGCVVYEDYYH